MLLYNQRLVKFADGKFHFAGKQQSPITYTMNYSELPTLPDRTNCSYSGPTRVTGPVTGPESLYTNHLFVVIKKIYSYVFPISSVGFS